MLIYIVLELIVGIVAGLMLAIRTKKSEDITYGMLDKVGRITNILLLLGYVYLSPVYLFLGMIFRPRHDGFLAIIGWIVSVIGASAAIVCYLGLGASVALRKKGKSKLSFAVQFAGVVAIALTILIYYAFEGNLLSSLN